MRYGIFGGAVNDGTVDDVVAEARSAEQDGFASFWAPNIFGHDALTSLAIVGREVPRIELGTSVVPTYPRHPHAIAQQCHTVAAASGNRLTLGIGLSHKIVIENMLGMSYDKPVRHLKEYLSVLMPLSRNEPANFDGETYKVHGGIAAKGSNGFGVVVAALGEQMLRVTAAMADGTLTWCTGPGTLSSHTIPTINRAAEEFGRPAPRVIAALPVCVTQDKEAAAARAASHPAAPARLQGQGQAGLVKSPCLHSAHPVHHPCLPRTCVVQVGQGVQHAGEGQGHPFLPVHPFSHQPLPPRPLQRPQDVAAQGFSDEEMAVIVAPMRRKALVGSAATVRQKMQALARSLELDHLVVNTWAHEPAVRRHSYALIAQAFELTGSTASVAVA